ncbi:hypothetical protein [Geodermatophilus sp. SYSU D00700]
MTKPEDNGDPFHPGAPAEPESWFYEGVGRVVMACAWLDMQMAALACLLTRSEDPFAVASEPGRPLRDLRRLSSQLPRGPLPTLVRGLVREAEALVAERNRITHSLITGGCTPGTPFMLLHPRKAEIAVARHEPLPTCDELRDLERQIDDLTWRVCHACVPAGEYAQGTADGQQDTRG